MCLSRSGVRSISGFRRAFSTNGATAFTSCVSSSSTDETSSSSSRHEFRSRRSTCCRSWSSRPSGKRSCAPRSSGQQRDLRQLGRRARCRRAGSISVRRTPSNPPSSRRTCAGIRVDRRCSSLEHVPVEPGGRRTVWQALLMMKSSRSRVVEQVRAERLDARRVPQVEPEDLEPVAPLVEVRLLRVARRRVAREARRHDQLRAGAQQLDPGLVADLHAAAGEQRHAAAEVGRLGPLGEVEVAARPGRAGRRSGGPRCMPACRRSSAAARSASPSRAPRARPARPSAGRVRRREDRLLAQHADARLRAQPLVAAHLSAFCRLPLVLDPRRRSTTLGLKTSPAAAQQPRALLDRKSLQHAAIADDRLERLDGVAAAPARCPAARRSSRR